MRPPHAMSTNTRWGDVHMSFSPENPSASTGDAEGGRRKGGRRHGSLTMGL